MKKADALRRWKQLREGQDFMKHLVPIPYGQRGPKYGSCGLRIEGNTAFVDAVLSHLKPLLEAENDVTRLGLSRKVVEPREDTDEPNPYADGEHEVAYIRVHMRGGTEGILPGGKDTGRFTELTSSGRRANE